MLKYVLITLSIYYSLCLVESWNIGSGKIISSKMTPEISKAVLWSTDKIANFTGIDGTYKIKTVWDIKVQIVRGSKYFLVIT
jgi:hypothetical protein